MPSLQHHIDGNTIASDIRMSRKTHKGSFLIVEGDTDSRFYSQFIECSNCSIIIGIKDANVIQALNVLEKSGFDGVLGIIDTDYRKLENEKLDVINIVMTDTHDLETMIIKSPGFDGLLCEYCDSTKLNKFTKGKDLREILINQTKLIGHLRWYSKRFNLGLKFTGLNFYTFVNENNLEVDLDKLLTAVVNNTNQCAIDKNETKKSVQALIKLKADCWQVCQGHDMSNILLIGIKKIFGGKNIRGMHRAALEGYLRLAYNKNDFYKTKIYDEIRIWEKKNKSYTIFSSVN